VLQKNLDRVNVITTPPKSGKRLKDFIPEWLTQIAVHQAASSLRAVESHINMHIIPRIGECSLTEVDNRTVQAFVTSLSAGGRTRKTIENILNTLSSILNGAKRMGYACAQITRKELTLPRKSVGREVRSFDVAASGSIIALAKEPYATMFSVLSMAGLRASEMLALKIIDLDFPRKLIHIQRSVDSRTREIQPTKSEASRADVPMPVELENRLQAFIQHQWRDNPNGFLFVNRNGNIYAIGKVVEYGLWPAQDACGIPRSGLHAFRHQVASELLEGGASPATVQKQLRHSDARVTLNRYSHVIGDAQRVAVSSMAARIEKQVSRQLESTS
jgi:integrase